jgi:DNA-directed RNA polymerase subunit H
MHIFQPKHTKLKPTDVEELMEKYNVSLSQLPKIKLEDSALPKDCKTGDIIKIERKSGDEEVEIFYRVVV